MNNKTGKELEDLDHLKQSIVDILTTAKGSRIMQREYGSRLLELVDKPMNRDTVLFVNKKIIKISNNQLILNITTFFRASSILKLKKI